jgi:hypothetical protein
MKLKLVELGRERGREVERERERERDKKTDICFQKQKGDTLKICSAM